MIETTSMRIVVTMVALLGATACDDDGGQSVAGDGADAALETSVAETADSAVSGDVGEVDETGAASEVGEVGEIVGPSGDITVGANACCLTMDGDLVIWSDDGDLRMWNAATNETSKVVAGPGIQKDPVLAGGTLVWADNRGGDFDLWMMRLLPEPDEPRLLRGGPGDQAQPVLDGTRLVWIGADLPPHTAREAEVFTVDLAVEGSERQLTNDGYEQTQPAVSGDRIVWADFAHSPDAMYVDIADPLRNNADIFGWDLARDEAFIVTDNVSKQLRPAIEGETVVWLDWRDINPEPKYSEFQVFARDLREAGAAAERRLAWSSWSRPDLWRRPAIADGVVVFIAEPTGNSGSFVTGMWAVAAEGGAPWLVTGTNSVLESVAVSANKAAYVGAGAIGRVEIRR